MGTFRYPMVVYSQDKSRSLEIHALVDTGSTYSCISRSVLENLGYRPSLRRKFRLADGRVIEREVAEIVAQLNGEQLTTLSVFGEPGSDNLLGALTLEAFSLAPDPVSKRLVPVEALLM